MLLETFRVYVAPCIRDVNELCYIQLCARDRVNRCTCVCECVRARLRARGRVTMCIHTHTHTQCIHIYTQIRARAHTHTHNAYIYILKYAFVSWWGNSFRYQWRHDLCSVVGLV
jgi:hypothetical protein